MRHQFSWSRRGTASKTPPPRKGAKAALIASVAVPLGLLAASAGYGQDTATGEDARLEGPGWTGLTHPDDIIAARQSLMTELSQMIAPLDFYAVGEEGDLPNMQAAANSISALLLITPHLFPPTTDVYGEEDAAVSTVALPSIWEDFDTFYDLTAETSTIAFEASQIDDPEEFRAAASRLRTACDACHASFMQEYSLEIPQGTDIDLDSLFE